MLRRIFAGCPKGDVNHHFGSNRDFSATSIRRHRNLAREKRATPIPQRAGNGAVLRAVIGWTSRTVRSLREYATPSSATSRCLRNFLGKFSCEIALKFPILLKNGLHCPQNGLFFSKPNVVKKSFFDKGKFSITISACLSDHATKSRRKTLTGSEISWPFKK